MYMTGDQSEQTRGPSVHWQVSFTVRSLLAVMRLESRLPSVAGS